MGGNAGERADLTKGDETRQVAVRRWGYVGDRRTFAQRQYVDVLKDGLRYRGKLVPGQDSAGKTRGQTEHAPDKGEKNKRECWMGSSVYAEKAWMIVVSRPERV